MTKYVETLTAFLSLHPYVAYAAVFLAALSEAVPIAGIIIPGSVIIIGLSALIPIGVIDFWSTAFFAVIGAIIGDGLSYWLGRRYQRTILLLWPFSHYKSLEARSEAFFQMHGAKSVFFGRFVPALRPFVPLFAGILRMEPVKFYAYNVLSALVWAPAHILPGMLLGASLAMAGAVVGRLATIFLLLLVMLSSAVWLSRYVLNNGMHWLENAEDRARIWSQRSSTWPQRLAGNILKVVNRKHRATMLAVTIFAASLWLFLGVLEDVVSGDPLVKVDRGVLELVQNFRTPLADSFFIAVTEIGDSFVVIAVAGALLIWLLGRRAWRTAIYWLIAVSLSSFINTLIKATVYRSRPTEGLYVGWSDLSFPSGHATVNTTMYMFLAFLVARELAPSRRFLVVAVSASLIVLIAFSRVYLGAHWFSDAIAGVAFGAAWCMLVILAYMQHRPEPLRPVGLLVTAAIALLIFGAVHIGVNHAANTEHYAVRQISRTTLAAADWQRDGWNQLPVFRTDIVGESEEPLSIQWAGNIKAIKEQLMRSGWQEAKPWSSAGILTTLVPEPRVIDIPVVPKLEDGRFPALALTMVAPNNNRYVLRLWSTSVAIDRLNSKILPLFVGSVTTEKTERFLWLATFPQTLPNAVLQSDQFQTLIPSGIHVRRTLATSTPLWNGEVTLIVEPNDQAIMP